MNKSEPCATEYSCVSEKCRYPQTCEWNQRCMEAEMKKSLDAKMVSGMMGKQEEDE